jgi:predicted histidine transporter YuiF (NhaC family)
MNPVVISVCLMLILALMRVNVVIALTLSALVGGLSAGISLTDTIAAFESGLGGGATIALSYAMLGTFAVAISKSGITDLLAQSVIKKIHHKEHAGASIGLKYLVLVALGLVDLS